MNGDSTTMSKAMGIMSIGALRALGSIAQIATAMAATFAQSGSSASSGQIAQGDNQRLSAFLSRPEASSISVIYLDSPAAMSMKPKR